MYENEEIKEMTESKSGDDREKTKLEEKLWKSIHDGEKRGEDSNDIKHLMNSNESDSNKLAHGNDSKQQLGVNNFENGK